MLQKQAGETASYDAATRCGKTMWQDDAARRCGILHKHLHKHTLNHVQDALTFAPHCRACAGEQQSRAREREPDALGRLEPEAAPVRH